MKKITIAIDGYSSSGKSTMARDLARRIGYTYIDSGVTLYAMRHGMIDPQGKVDTAALTAALPDIHISFAPASTTDGVQHTQLNGEDVERDIRGMEVSEHVSPVAVIPEVRERLVKLQQDFGRTGGIVMDGRDIGTVVFPDAELKIYVDASAETRARRRFKEMIDKGSAVTFEEVLANVVHRDHIDTTRAESPLRRADDAIAIDNSNMTIEEQDAWLLDQFERVTNAK